MTSAGSTRDALLEAGYEEIYREGFRAARIDRIVERTGVTKGSFYHHFPTKRALGEAVLEESICRLFESLWIEPLESGDDPLEVTYRVFQYLLENASALGLDKGCPLNNLAQELSPVDEQFRLQIRQVFERWVQKLAQTIEAAQWKGSIRDDVDPAGVSLFVVSAIEGALGLGKNAQDIGVLAPWLGALRGYIDSLRPVGSGTTLPDE